MLDIAVETRSFGDQRCAMPPLPRQWASSTVWPPFWYFNSAAEQNKLTLAEGNAEIANITKIIGLEYPGLIGFVHTSHAESLLVLIDFHSAVCWQAQERVPLCEFFAIWLHHGASVADDFPATRQASHSVILSILPRLHRGADCTPRASSFDNALSTTISPCSWDPNWGDDRPRLWWLPHQRTDSKLHSALAFASAVLVWSAMTELQTYQVAIIVRTAWLHDGVCDSYCGEHSHCNVRIHHLHTLSLIEPFWYLLFSHSDALWPSEVKVSRRGSTQQFFTMQARAMEELNNPKVFQQISIQEYEQWKSQNNNGKGWHLKYYKGHGMLWIPFFNTRFPCFSVTSL